jgi:hypothetical protein
MVTTNSKGREPADTIPDATMSCAKTYSDVCTDGLMNVWKIERIWKLARSLPIKRVPLDQITDFNLVTWFNSRYQPTCRAVAEHAKRIEQVSFEHPIVLSAAGHVMDGMHRVAKAWILGMEDINAVQFDKDPEPDERVPPNL